MHRAPDTGELGRYLGLTRLTGVNRNDGTFRRADVVTPPRVYDPRDQEGNLTVAHELIGHANGIEHMPTGTMRLLIPQSENPRIDPPFWRILDGVFRNPLMTDFRTALQKIADELSMRLTKGERIIQDPADYVKTYVCRSYR